MLAAGKDDKYQVIQKVSTTTEEGYKKLSDVDDFLDAITASNYTDYTGSADSVKEAQLSSIGVNKKGEDIKDLYMINGGSGLSSDDYFLVNTSGKVIDSKTKSTDGSDFVYVTAKGGKILAIYSED